MTDNDFTAWLQAVGLNRKQFAEAGNMIGMNAVSITRRNQGLTAWSEAERMAMTLAWLDLPPWEARFNDLDDSAKSVIQAAADVIRRALSVPESLSGEGVPPTTENRQS